MSSPLNLTPDGTDGGDPIGTPPPPPATPQPAAPLTPAPAAPPPAAAGGMPDFQQWRSSLDPELRDQPSLQDIESFEGLVREHANVQKFIGGDKISKPGAESTPEDWDRFYGAMGRPDQADGYDLTEFKVPDNVPWDQGFQDRMVGVLHKHGVGQRQMVGILQDYASNTGERYAAAKAQQNTYTQESQRALETEWGGAYDGNTAIAEEAFKKTFGDDLNVIANAVLPDGTPIGDHPTFMKAFFKIGREMREHGMIGDPSRRVAAVVTPSEAKGQIAALEADPEFRKIMVDPTQAQHPKRVLWGQLYEALEGDAL